MPRKQGQENIERIGWALRRVVSLMHQDSFAMMKESGITGPQSLAMRCLHQSPDPLPSTALSRELGVTAANVTGIIDRLVDKQYVERIRNDDDRRKVLLQLTEAGTQKAGSLRGPMEGKLTQGLGALPPDEIDRIRKALDALIGSLGTDRRGAP